MDNGRAPRLVANTFNMCLIRAYANRHDYFHQSVRLQWLFSYEWKNRCRVVPSSLGPLIFHNHVVAATHFDFAPPLVPGYGY